MVTLPLRKWTRNEYHMAADAGIIRADERVELLDGQILEKMTQNPPHAMSIVLAVFSMAGLVALPIILPVWSKPHSSSRRAVRLLQWQLLQKQIAVLRKQATAASRRSRYAEAVAIDQEILKLSPHDLAAYADLGKSYDALGDVDQALKSFRIAFVTKFPNVRGGVWDPYAYNRFGELSMQTGDLETARDSFAAALTGAQEVAGGITPHFTNETSLDEMHALAASAIVNDAKLGDRLAAAEHASKLFPNSVYVECVYGWNLFIRNQFRDAASVYSHAIALASPSEKIKITPFVRLLRLNRPRTVVIAADGREEPSSNVTTPWNGPLTTPSFGASRIHRTTPLP